MTSEAPEPPETSAARPAGGPTAAGDHAHDWHLMRFELVDGRPMVRQDCRSCGLVRRYRAWERSWTPGSPEVRR